jgi:hypothetical protein
LQTATFTWSFVQEPPGCTWKSSKSSASSCTFHTTYANYDYTSFTLELRAKDSKSEGYGWLDIMPMRPPCGGQVSTTMIEKTASWTTYLISATGWMDVEPTNMPLSYQIFV